MEVDKNQLCSILEKIPTETELRHLVTCWILEAQVLSQQAEHYQTTIDNTSKHIQENEVMMLKIHDRIRNAQVDIRAKEQELLTIGNRIPRIQRECAQLEIDNG